ncbi:hypothetical protein EUTSA_v10000335mg [Eutrema salsugineum]|uniref:PLAT domain-containing protein n=1 Tax=Eutrema salsugineum TaxID=72664 RepID=V4L6Y0_EUTSA|nr:PLAT domain-containing protein 2 [Eutrema salsugineum]ESQ46120.1 hypothetical protein EUTSA_v10000335mg [Eutrema salsugineum]
MSYTFISPTMARCDVLLLSLLLIAAVSVVAFADREVDCVYTFYLKTGSLDGAGTDSIISANISDKAGQEIVIKNLVTWGGLMGQGYDYFENGNVDIFSGKERCLPSPVCSLSLTSDNSGHKPAWYVEYVEFTTSKVRADSTYQYFNVSQWLSTDFPPYNLTAVRKNCPVSLSEGVGPVGSDQISMNLS